MAKQALTDATVLYGGYDISGLTNVIGGLAVEVELKESTTFVNGGWKEQVGVLKGSRWGFEGLFNAGEAGPHGAFFTGGVTPITVSKTQPIVAGDIAFNLNALRTQHNEDKTLGELHKWQLDFAGDGAMVRGICLDTQAATGTADGTAINHGAVASGQSAYAALHVVAADTLTSLDVVIESDAADDFSGSETTRFTFTQVTAVPAVQRIALAGPITDDWWRASWTLVGTSATFIVFFGIQ